METIRSSHEQGLFRDLRLVRPALQALDDSYSEISEFIAKEVLPMYGPALLPELEGQFNPKGKAGQPRRLQLMHQLDPVRARSHVHAALEEGSKELRVAAIGCLGTSEEDLPFLLEQAKAKARDVRHAALTSLARLDHEEATKVLIKQINAKDVEPATLAMQTTHNSAVVSALIAATREQLDRLTNTKFKTKADEAKESEYFICLLRCLHGREDKDSEALHLELVESVEKWKDATEQTAMNVLAINLANGSLAMKQALCSMHASLPPSQMGNVFLAASRVWSAEQVYEELSPYAIAFAGVTGKKHNLNQQKGEVLTEQLAVPNRPIYRGQVTYEPASISKNWLKLAIEKNIEPVILNLASLDKSASWPALKKLFDKYIKAKSGSRDFWTLHTVTNAMVSVQHPDSVDAMIAVIQRLSETTSGYYGAWILNKISDLPAAEAVPKLEALLPSIKDKVADEVIGHIYVLKHGLTK
jgi:hypothetical protein